MCGIAGIINFNNKDVSEEDVISLISVLKHRGPDDEGVYLNDNIGLGFVRLSIIDLSPAGHQPMISRNNNYVIVFNGEIFNYIELREELKKLGYVFYTNTDTEVLLNSYIHWGEDCLNRLNGMWAFAIFNKINRSIFISRDRYGIKPFYYFLSEDKFIFASEIPAILKILESKPNANCKAIYDFLVFNRTDQSSETFFEEIRKLQHGHSIRLNFDCNDNKFFINRWYNLAENLNSTFNSTQEYLEMLTSAINIRLRSDVPLGVCLSGGLDSSSIVSILVKNNPNLNLNTFSAIYNKNDIGDESDFISEYKNLIDNMNFVKPSAESFFEDLNTVMEIHSEPFPSTSPYAQFKVFELASRSVKVTLDGQGADEQLGGYHYFYGIYFKELLFNLKFGSLIYQVITYIRIHRSLYGLKTLLYFLLPKRLMALLRVKEKGYINKEFIDKNIKNSVIVDELYSSKNFKSSLVNHFEHKLEHLLKWEDVNSMHFSIEARVPFLDHRLVEKTLALPINKLINGSRTKVILRESVKDIIPDNILNRVDKVGFGTPEAEWFRTPRFSEFILEMLNSESFKKRKIIEYKKAVLLYKSHLKKDIDISREIWKWINLEIWFRKYID